MPLRRDPHRHRHDDHQPLWYKVIFAVGVILIIGGMIYALFFAPRPN